MSCVVVDTGREVCMRGELARTPCCRTRGHKPQCPPQECDPGPCASAAPVPAECSLCSSAKMENQRQDSPPSLEMAEQRVQTPGEHDAASGWPAAAPCRWRVDPPGTRGPARGARQPAGPFRRSRRQSSERGARRCRTCRQGGNETLRLGGVPAAGPRASRTPAGRGPALTGQRQDTRQRCFCPQPHTLRTPQAHDRPHAGPGRRPPSPGSEPPAVRACVSFRTSVLHFRDFFTRKTRST